MPENKQRRGVPYRTARVKKMGSWYRVDCSECNNRASVLVTHSDRVPAELRKRLWGQRKATRLWICPACKDESDV